MRRIAPVFFALSMSLSAFAADNSGPTVSNQHHITISDGILIPSHFDSSHASGFFTIRNNDNVDHLLSGISSPDCASVVAHHSNQESTQLTNNLFTHLALPHNSTMIFPPSGYHIVCLGLKSSLSAGDKHSFTFKFLDGETVTTDFIVESKR